MLVYETMGQKYFSSLNRIVLQNKYHYDNLWVSFTLFRRQKNVEFKSDFQIFLPYYAYALAGLGNYKYWLIAWESDSNFASCLPINKFKIKV